MTAAPRNQNDFPDVPEVDFVGAVCEIWFAINYAAYHQAYVRVYLQTAALQTKPDELKKYEQVLRDMTQSDLIICRAHLAAFFWQLDHVFEALRAATTRGQKEHPNLKFFWAYEKKLDEIKALEISREISDYRNKAHDIPAIIGCSWDSEGKFRHHFLPTIAGHEAKEEIDLTDQLQKYFEFVANVWLSFVPEKLRTQFPRDFRFTISVPHSYIGDLPAELKDAPQLQVWIESFERAHEQKAGEAKAAEPASS